MKKTLSLILILILIISLASCGKMSAEQRIVKAVNEIVQSKDFASYQELYKQFKSESPSAPKVTNVTHYQIEDFDGVKMDCYLVNVSAGVAYWINEQEYQGAAEENFYVFVDANKNVFYDSISTNALGGDHDTSTAQGRATYLMWIYANIQSGEYQGDYLNDSETVTEMSADVIAAVNENLK